MSASVHWHKWSTKVSTAILGRRLRAVPMLVVLIPFICGIVAADSFILPLYVVLALLAVVCVVAWLVLPRGVAWGYVAMALLLLGYVVAELRHPASSVPYDTKLSIVGEVVGEVMPRDGYRIAEGRVRAWREDKDDVWREANERVRLWIRSDSVAAGDRFEAYTHIVSRISRHAEYDELLHRRGYVGGMGISDYNISLLEHNGPHGLHLRALNKLRSYAADTASYATIEAMVAGSRSMMPATLREAYSRTGLAHLMAVSGLHLGIVVLLAMALLRPLSLVHRGHIVANLLVIVVLWLYAVVSGMSPSVMRAAVMLSVCQLSRATSSRYNSINGLAITIFLMLVIRPDNLYDISFQLSVAAVFGILLWAVPVVRYLGLRRGILGLLATSMVVGVVATLWTLPLVSNNFGNIPLIGVVITPLAMITAYAIVGCGIAALLLPDMLASPLMSVAHYAASLQNSLVEMAAAPSWCAVEYRLGDGGVALCYLLYAIITLVAWSMERKKRVSLSRSYDT